MQQTNWLAAGAEPAAGVKSLIMIHGRGASPEDIIGLADHLPVQEFSLLAPRARGGSWYPYSFMAPVQQNQPWLDDSLASVDEVLQHALNSGVAPRDLYLLGFSQGACLALEYLARQTGRYGGVMAFTGGLIGAQLNPDNYRGSLQETPVFIGSGDPDPHVPAGRVRETEVQLRKLGADVLVQIYPGMPHTVTLEELKLASDHVLTRSTAG